MENRKEIAARLLNKPYEEMNATEKHVLQHLSDNEPISRNIQSDIAGKLTFGQKIADKVAAFGGSWPFIIIFLCFLAFWIGLNIFLLITYKKTFDPYPFILLNLFLSMIASLQAPVIMMSQNRQAVHDRADASHDYEVNLKAELEIAQLHLKIDEIREKQMTELLTMLESQNKKLAEMEHTLKALQASPEPMKPNQ
jgi:uncharacterized membrane protein